MQSKSVEHYDYLGDVIVFWVNISNVPQSTQAEARKIDRSNFAPDRFGICVNYDFEKKQFYVVADTEFSAENPRNVYYIDSDGDKHWFAIELPHNFIEQAFLLCVKAVADDECGAKPTERDAIQSASQAGSLN